METPRSLRACIALVVAGAATVALAVPRDPSGETASYELDKNSARTSSLVESGSMKAAVGAHTDDQDGPAYAIDVDYDFQISLIGKKTGTETVSAPDQYFDPAFMVNLRKTGHYESPKFKIDYLGMEDATTLDGHSFKSCDKIKIYDIKEAGPLQNVAAAMLGAPDFSSLQNLVIVADIAAGVPVLGAAKLDVSGQYSGMNVKAGGDYQTP